RLEELSFLASNHRYLLERNLFLGLVDLAANLFAYRAALLLQHIGLSDLRDLRLRRGYDPYSRLFVRQDLPPCTLCGRRVGLRGVFLDGARPRIQPGSWCRTNDLCVVCPEGWLFLRRDAHAQHRERKR